MEFCVGDLIEVCSSQDGFRGSYLLAKIVSSDQGNGTYQVQYENLVAKDETTLLIETVMPNEVRQVPPELTLSRFSLFDRVDAYDLDGWWVGTISRVKSNGMYSVYFDSSKDEHEYPYSRLRVHMEFQDMSWIIS